MKKYQIKDVVESLRSILFAAKSLQQGVGVLIFAAKFSAPQMSLKI